MMHVLDYDRALGELLELDDTIRATMERKCGELCCAKRRGITARSRFEEHGRVG